MGHLFQLRTCSERVVVSFSLSSLHNCFRVLGLARFRIDDSFLGENGCLMVQALVDSEGSFVDISAVWPITMNPQTILCEKHWQVLVWVVSFLEILDHCLNWRFYNRIGHIPVIDEKGMVGMVSIGDVVHVGVREHRQEFEHLNAFIQGVIR